MAEAVHVIVRVRPQNALESSKGGKMAVTLKGSKEIQIETAGEGFGRFTFDHVFGPDSSQSQVFDSIGQPLVENVFEGYNGTIFAYGQTSSGKTYTMQGPEITDSELAGIIPRTVAAIFETIGQSSENMEFTVRASYVEIYLERIRDLLDPSRQNLQVREDPNKGVYVEGMSEQYVNSFEEMMQLMEIGSKNRAQAATGMNEGSSRSHSVFVLQLVQTDTKTGTTKASKINLVDLAGSEMVRKTGATGERLDEAKMINLSLSALGKVINALTDGKSTHIPYRDSKLTRMLQESLGGNARTWLVINVSPSSYNAPETLSTLRFGNRAKAIKNKAVVNRVRTVEELELLLAQAERAIDAQARFIEKLKGKLATSNPQLSSQQHGGEKIDKQQEQQLQNQNDVNHKEDDAEKAQRFVEMELKLKQLEEMHDNDTQELDRSATEIRILTEEIQELKANLEHTTSTKTAQIEALNEKLAALSQDYTSAQSKLDEANSKLDHVEYEHKELQLTVATLQKENEKLNKELDSLPATAVASAEGLPAPVSAPSVPVSQDISAYEDPASQIKALQDANQKLHSELDSMKRSYEAKLAELQQAVKTNSDGSTPTSSTSTRIDPALEQRLYQLIAVHKQLLRKYAYAELAAAEKAQLLALKDERIRILEGNLKTKEFNFRAQGERHALELEELQIEHQRQIQELQLELSKSRREAAENKSFSAKAISFIQSRTRSPQNSTGGGSGNRIVKPIRGGGASSGASLIKSTDRSKVSSEGGTSSSSPTGSSSRFFGWLSPKKQSRDKSPPPPSDSAPSADDETGQLETETQEQDAADETTKAAEQQGDKQEQDEED